MTDDCIRGVYFLANDDVYENVVAFLNSFRKHNARSQLCLIPFNESWRKIKELQRIYNFSIYADDDVLRQCDEVSKLFHEETCGAYRKLAAWSGEFEEFIYIDVDTVVLDSVDFAYQNLVHADICTSHSNMPELRQWVWQQSIFNDGCLTKEQIEYSANTGFIVSNKAALPFSWVIGRVNRGLELKKHMTLCCMEQPFLNYLIVTSGKRYSSFTHLFSMGIRENIKLERWAGSEQGVFLHGKLFTRSGVPVFLVHWAGSWRRETMPYRKLWMYYRNLREELRYPAF